MYKRLPISIIFLPRNSPLNDDRLTEVLPSNKDSGLWTLAVFLDPLPLASLVVHLEENVCQHGLSGAVCLLEDLLIFTQSYTQYITLLWARVV